MFSEKLKLLRIEHKCTQEMLADAIGVAKSTISMYENGKRQPDFETLEAIADYFNVNMSKLIDRNSGFCEPRITDDVITFPVIGEIAAGYEHIAYEDWSGDTVDIPYSCLKGHKKDDFFVLSVKGDSMYPFYLDGDKVLILKQETAENGSVAAVLYNDEKATLKKIEVTKNKLTVTPFNAYYPPQEFEGEELDHCRIIGVPKLLIREF